MKKFLLMLAFIATIAVFTACDDDSPQDIDEGEDPALVSTLWHSTNPKQGEPHFDFNLKKDDTGKATVRMHDIQFRIGAVTTSKLNIRIDAPLSRKGKVYTYKGAEIVPLMIKDGIEVPAEDFIVTNYIVTVDVELKTYHITFNSNRGPYRSSGSIYADLNPTDYTVWTSIYDSETDEYMLFNLKKDPKGNGTIELHNVVFTRGDAQPSKIQKIRIDAPISQKGNVYTYEGTDIVPYMMTSNGIEVPAEKFLVKDLKAVIDVEKFTYSLYFKINGGEFKRSGAIRSPQN